MKKVSEWMRKPMKAVIVMLLAGFMGACTDNTTTPPARQTVTDVVLANNDFTILRDAIQYAGLADALRLGTLTVFAPNDAAFRASGFANAAAVRALPVATVKSVLQYHVLGSKIAAANIPVARNTAVATLEGPNLFVSKLTASSGVSVNNARVTTADVMADNGVIHVIDRVMRPPALNLLQVAQGNPDFTYLVAAATRASTTNPAVVNALTSTTSAFTVFAPTNQAFIDAGFPTIASINAAPAATLAAVVLNHVLADRAFSPTLATGNATTAGGGVLALTVSANGVTVAGKGNTQPANVVSADILATNGVVHVVSRVLLP